ncbi:MAG: hypothetical protein ISR65_02820 [Bacteriovoracaceae bacterium]|nr:hypothetical protein [Bacteriovoracaceae bacterium]
MDIIGLPLLLLTIYFVFELCVLAVIWLVAKIIAKLLIASAYIIGTIIEMPFRFIRWIYSKIRRNKKQHHPRSKEEYLTKYQREYQLYLQRCRREVL